MQSVRAYILLLLPTLLLLNTFSCGIKKASDKTLNMAEAIEQLNLKTGETHRVVLNSRGAIGLQLLFKADQESIVEVSRVAPPDIGTTTSPGDPVKAYYNIKAIHPGTVKITFYESRTWDKSFQDIIQKEIAVQVVE